MAFDEVKRDYQNQIADINNKVQKYQKDMAEYNQKLSQAGKNVVDSRSVIQSLVIESDTNSKLTVTNIKGTDSSNYGPNDNQKLNGKEDFGPGFGILPKESENDVSFDATWSNLSKITYQDRKITKVTMHFDLTRYPNTADNWGYILISQNLYNGFVINQYYANSITISMYYDNGEKVNFEKGTAYLAVASLNTYKDKARWGQETTKVLSGGKALALYGSSVSYHDGNSLYSDKANSNDANGKDRAVLGNWDYQPWEIYPNEAELTNANIPDNWDSFTSPNRYYGAGLIALSGDTLKLNIFVNHDGMPSDSHPWNGQWFNVGTVIPETPDINRPQPPQISYHLDSALLCLFYCLL